MASFFTRKDKKKENTATTGTVSGSKADADTKGKATEKAKLKATEAHSQLKSKFAVVAVTNDDEVDPNARIREDELSKNPKTALFLTLRDGRWPTFPKLMQGLWILSIVFATGVQGTAALLLFAYFQKINDLVSGASDGQILEAAGEAIGLSNLFRIFSAIVACTMLFVYVMSELRKSIRTLRHYWAILEISVLQYFLFGVFVLDIALHLGVALLSVIAIGQQDNISDQVGISLSFFFILEFDEWIYDAIIQDFDVLQDDDFIVKYIDGTKDDNLDAFYLNKSKVALFWVFILTLGLGFVVVYYFVAT